jgi:hypothetical protein
MIPAKEVFERINQWENLGFGVCGGEGWVENPHSSSPVTVCLEHSGGQLFFKGKRASIELLKPTLTRIVLASGDKVHFSID